MSSHRNLCHRFGTLATLLLTIGLPIAAAAPARGACNANTGAKGTPSILWGQLQPTDVGSVPDARDTTEYVGGAMLTNYTHPLFSSIDVEEGYAFTSYAMGFHVWNVQGDDASDPEMISYRDQGDFGPYAQSFLENIGHQEQRWLLWDIDAPPGHSNLVAMTGIAPFGIAIWDTSNKQSPKILYQDKGRSAHQVFATTIDGRHYAFTASSRQGAQGLLMYDMTRAKELYGSSSGCLEDTTVGTGCGVFEQRLGGQQGFNYVDGFTTAGGKTFVVASGGPGDTFPQGPKGIVLWDVTNPDNPVDLLDGSRLFADETIVGLAAWEQGGRQFLAFQPYNDNARIHEIGGCLASGCSSPPLTWTADWPASPYYLKTHTRLVTYSKGANGTGYLYFGNEFVCKEVPQGEWIFDLSNLTTTGPEEITPEGTQTVEGKTIGYWGHYYGPQYVEGKHGFNRVVPRVGKVSGNHFYRAAWTLFDVHQLVDVDPTLTVDGPSTAYAGDPVAFTASAVSCTPDPNGWSWTATGTTVNDFDASATITFADPGTKTVSVTNTGCPNAAVVPATIQILDPAPAVSSVTASPGSPLLCQPVTLTANGVTGKAPLSYSWTVKDGQGQDAPGFSTSNQNPKTWNVDPSTTPGSFTATVTVSGIGDPATKSTTVNVQTLPPLESPAAPTNDPFTAGTVQFHGTATGATEWNWDFGDGAGYTGWTSDPVNGPNPLHTYDSIGQKTVRLKVRNCRDAEKVSPPLSIEIEQIAPLEIVTFQAQGANVFCQSFICFADQGKPITFGIEVGGDPVSWSIRWDDGTSDATGSGNPPSSISHTYQTAGDYEPKLTIERGTETEDKTHTQISVAAGAPASVSVSGPSSGKVGTALTFSASASNCSPSPNGWTWTASGTTVSSSTSSASITFPSAGTKSVTAKNSACGSATGFKSVSISSEDDDGGGGIGADFSFTPSSPKAGQPVTFDASASEGSGLAYFWEFGDGNTAVSKVVSHTFAKAGTYRVELSVSEKGCLSAGCANSKITRTVVVGGGLSATFETSAECKNEFGIQSCQAAVAQEVSFTGDPAADTHEWDFGDGSTAVGKNVTHSWEDAGLYSLTYTAKSDHESATISRSFVVDGTCAGSETGICLKQGRFLVEAEWWNDKGEGGKAKPVRLTGDTAYFWFFAKDNVEIVAKILDGTKLTGHFWVYYASLSSVGFEMTVTDTETGNSKTYRNESGSMASRGDVTALPATQPEGQGLTFVSVEPSSLGMIPLSDESHAGDGACQATESRLCLGPDGRWAVDVTFKESEGVVKQGRAEVLTDRTGYFWFFKSTNVEIITKILDGRKVNGKYWVFYASLTDVEFDLTVTDLHTGAQATYHNDAGVLASRGDIDALPSS